MVQQGLRQLQVGWRACCLGPESPGQESGYQAHICRRREISQQQQAVLCSLLVSGIGKQQPHSYCNTCTCRQSNSSIKVLLSPRCLSRGIRRPTSAWCAHHMVSIVRAHASLQPTSHRVLDRVLTNSSGSFDQGIRLSFRNQHSLLGLSLFKPCKDRACELPVSSCQQALQQG